MNNTKRYPETVAEDPGVYEAFQQRPVGYFSLMVRTAGDPDGLLSGLRGAVAQIDPELPLARVLSEQTVLERAMAGDSFFSRTLGSFAVLALMLAAIGIYGLLAYSVGQRTHEIGIRMAMGAKSEDVLRMIVREGMKMALIGAAIGFAISVPLPKIFGAMFVDLHANEPRLFVLVPALILAVAVIATYIPARRAARLDPVKALRQE